LFEGGCRGGGEAGIAGITHEVERINFMVADQSRLENAKYLFSLSRVPLFRREERARLQLAGGGDGGVADVKRIDC
jgi:hypothetical protein